MKGQGTGLWLVAIGLIALFVLATMIAPALLNPADDEGGNGGGGSSEAISFKVPTIEIGDTELNEDDDTDLTLRTIASTPTTGEGGTFIWVLSVDGANGQAGAIQVEYGDQMVQWFGGGGGSLVGVGPRFSQGPGATPVEVSASFTVTPLVAGDYIIRAWVAEASRTITLDPSGLEACSPTSSRELKVNEKIKPEVTVGLDLSGPTTAREDRSVRFDLRSEGATVGKWNGSITDRIIIKESDIRPSDVEVRVDGERVSLTVVGSQLEGDLRTVRPFAGEDEVETAEWSVEIEIIFRTSGTYVIEGSSVDSLSREVLATTDGHSIDVSRTGGDSDDETNNSDSSDDDEAPAPVPPPELNPTPTPSADNDADGSGNDGTESSEADNNSSDS